MVARNGGNCGETGFFLFRPNDDQSPEPYAALHIARFEEFAHSNREVDYAVYENRPAQLPMCYLLEAAKDI